MYTDIHTHHQYFTTISKEVLLVLNCFLSYTLSKNKITICMKTKNKDNTFASHSPFIQVLTCHSLIKKIKYYSKLFTNRSAKCAVHFHSNINQTPAENRCNKSQENFGKFPQMKKKFLQKKTGPCKSWPNFDFARAIQKVVILKIKVGKEHCTCMHACHFMADMGWCV